MVCFNRPDHFRIFKVCPPQILIGPFLNNLSQVSHDNFSEIFWSVIFVTMDFFNPFQYPLFTPPERIRKHPNTRGSLMFSGGWKGHIDQKWVEIFKT